MTLDVYGHVMPDDESTHRAVTKMSETFAPQLLPPPDLPEDKRERKLTEDQVREIRRKDRRRRAASTHRSGDGRVAVPSTILKADAGGVGCLN